MNIPLLELSGDNVQDQVSAKSLGSKEVPLSSFAIISLCGSNSLYPSGWCGGRQWIAGRRRVGEAKLMAVEGVRALYYNGPAMVLPPAAKAPSIQQAHTSTLKKRPTPHTHTQTLTTVKPLVPPLSTSPLERGDPLPNAQNGRNV